MGEGGGGRFGGDTALYGGDTAPYTHASLGGVGGGAASLGGRGGGAGVGSIPDLLWIDREGGGRAGGAGGGGGAGMGNGSRVHILQATLYRECV